MLRRDFVERKLQLIAQDLGRLASMEDLSFEELIGDEIRLAAVERILERIVLRAIDVNEHIISQLATGAEEKSTRLTYRDTFLKLAEYGVCPPAFAQQIAPSAGLRNVLVHDYNDADRRIVHGAIRTALAQFATYIEHIEGFLDRRSPAAPGPTPGSDP